MIVHEEESKGKKGSIIQPQVSPEVYLAPAYDSKRRFNSYWHQIDEIIRLNPTSVLEIGLGNGFLSNYLRNRGLNITTMDIDERLRPDEVGTVTDIPFADGCFDIVACFEVLEHLPYHGFSTALQEIHRVSREHVVLSLPECTRAYRFNIQIPKMREVKWLVPLPRYRDRKHEFDGEHYWVIGKAGYPLGRITEDMITAGFVLVNTYRVFEMPSIRFFLLRKADQI